MKYEVDMDEGVLLCPVCKCNFLHLLGVQRSDADPVKVGENARLTYICEFEHHIMDLTLEQRKGETIMNWELKYE